MGYLKLMNYEANICVILCIADKINYKYSCTLPQFMFISLFWSLLKTAVYIFTKIFPVDDGL